MLETPRRASAREQTATRSRAARAAVRTFMVLRGPREPQAGLELEWLQGSPLHNARPLLLLPSFYPLAPGWVQRFKKRK